MDAMLLAWNFGDKERKALKNLCGKKSVRFRALAPEDLAQNVGALCRLSQRRDGPFPEREPPLEKLLLFANFGQKELTAFLSGLQTARLGKDAVKAALTPTNAQWDFYTLLDELRREREGLEGNKTE